MGNFNTIDNIEVSDLRVLVRADLNVPFESGKITDMTRIRRACQTLHELLGRGAKVVVMSHFGRPEGKFNPEHSLAAIADGLSVALGREVKFAVDCIGPDAESSVNSLNEGEIVLLENLRFHKGEEANDPEFVNALAKLGDVFVNDAFSCSHRAHASVVGLNKKMPHAAGRLMQEELENLQNILGNPQKPMAAIIGGSKVSSKLALLETLIEKVDLMIIGGGMANTFLKSNGVNIGKSICENDLLDTAKKIQEKAAKKNCEIFLPLDAVVASEFKPFANSKVVSITKIGEGIMLDIGPRTVAAAADKLAKMKTIVWNGPMGAFETKPFDTGTTSLAQIVASLDGVQTIAGGGDTVAALTNAAMANNFTYLSTAGGAFLEWLEGKTLPGVAALAAPEERLKKAN